MKHSIILILILLIGIQSCKLFDECEDCVTPPNPIWIKVVNANDTLQNLITTGVFVKDSIKMWYKNNSMKQYVDIRIINLNYTENVIQSNATYFTINEEPRDFYLYFNKDNIDTIQIQVDENYDGCCTSYQLESIKFNGSVPIFDPLDYTFLLKKEVDTKKLK